MIQALWLYDSLYDDSMYTLLYDSSLKSCFIALIPSGNGVELSDGNVHSLRTEHDGAFSKWTYREDDSTDEQSTMTREDLKKRISLW